MNVVRIIPPLVTTADEVDMALAILDEIARGRRSRLTPVAMDERRRARTGRRGRAAARAQGRGDPRPGARGSSSTWWSSRRRTPIRVAARERAREPRPSGPGAAALLDEAVARRARCRSVGRSRSAGFSGTWAATDMAVSVARVDRSGGRGRRARGGRDGGGGRGPVDVTISRPDAPFADRRSPRRRVGPHDRAESGPTFATSSSRGTRRVAYARDGPSASSDRHSPSRGPPADRSGGPPPVGRLPRRRRSTTRGR